MRVFNIDLWSFIRFNLVFEYRRTDLSSSVTQLAHLTPFIQLLVDHGCVHGEVEVRLRFGFVSVRIVSSGLVVVCHLNLVLDWTHRRFQFVHSMHGHWPLHHKVLDLNRSRWHCSVGGIHLLINQIE